MYSFLGVEEVVQRLGGLRVSLIKMAIGVVLVVKLSGMLLFLLDIGIVTLFLNHC